MGTGAFAPLSGHFPRQWTPPFPLPLPCRSASVNPLHRSRMPQEVGSEEALCMAQRLLPALFVGNHAGRRARARDSQRGGTLVRLMRRLQEEGTV
jgi:hypothetical protein